MAKRNTKDLRLYIHLPIRAYKDKRLWRYKKTFFILAALCSYTDIRGICWPNQSTLAKEFECSRQAIGHHIKKLMEFGYVKYARKEFKGQKGNTYFIIYDKKTTENMARKNVRLAEKPAEANTPEMERQEAIKTIDKVAKDIPMPTQPAKNEKIEIQARTLLLFMKKAIKEIYGKDFQYSNKQEETGYDMIERNNLTVDEKSYVTMRDALVWFRKAEPIKDAPYSILFFEKWLCPNVEKKSGKSVKNLARSIGNRLRWK